MDREPVEGPAGESAGEAERVEAEAGRYSERWADRSGRRSWVALLVGLAVLFGSAALWADARTDRLVNLLRTSGNYRVRVQSAQSLGRIRDPRSVPVLVEALGDHHPAVRAAAAQALGRIGSPEAITPLRRLAADSHQPREVRTQAQRAIEQIERMRSVGGGSSDPGAQGGTGGGGTPRFYIGIGEMGNTTGRRSGELEKTLAKLIRQELSKARGVKLAPPNESVRTTRRVLKATHLKGYFVQGSVTRLDEVNGQIHAVVSIMVLSNPGRDLRMMLQGRGIVTIRGATSVDPSRRRALEDSALEGAVRGAVTRLAQQLGVR